MYDDTNFFLKTSDLALATAISVLGVAIEAMQETDGERMNFIFTKSERLTDIVNRFLASKTPAQRASSVGWVVKKFNLATDKLSRSGKGNRYRFEKAKVEKVWGRYFASSPTSPTQELPSLDE